MMGKKKEKYRAESPFVVSVIKGTKFRRTDHSHLPTLCYKVIPRELTRERSTIKHFPLRWGEKKITRKHKARNSEPTHRPIEKSLRELQPSGYK